MKPVISIGTQDFAFLRQNRSFYIDKTAFIKEWWESQDAVTLITRPRRFGKTLNLSMVEYFFSNQYAGRQDLFEGLSVWKEERFRELQGTYPVIFLSFASIKGSTYEMTRESIIQVIINLFARFHFLLESETLNQQEKEYFSYIRPDMSDAEAAMSLHWLSICLYRHYGKKAVILLDEYDTPLQEAYVNGYWKALTDLMRSLFNCTFKTNRYLERGLMTGITRVSKESIFSDLNNLTVITTTTDRYADCFGFTEEEVFRALDTYGLSDQKTSVREWYDGFTFGAHGDIYNPWSITKYLDCRQFGAYWANTSSNSMVSKLIREGSPQVKMVMEDLLAGKELVTEIDEEIIFDQLKRKKGAIWSLLLASGYLKVAGRSFDGERYSYHLALTNKEVRLMFESMIRDWFAEAEESYSGFLSAMLQGDLDYMNEYMNRVAETVFSFFDTGAKKSEASYPERFYHGFVLGLVVELADSYRITSNRESGFGRYDVMLEPLDHQKPAFVLEFKVRNGRREETLQAALETALEQITEKRYDSELIARGIPAENIHLYGFAFEGKKVLIGQRTEQQVF